MRYTPTTAPVQHEIDIPSALAEIKERFAKALPILGSQNNRGTYRHQFECNFMYLNLELENGPRYMRLKRLEQLSQLTSTLINMGKLPRGAKVEKETVAA